MKNVKRISPINYYRVLSLLPLIGLMVMISSCSEIFEGDLDDDKFVVVAPGKELTTFNTQVQFIWQELEDATSYSLDIVSPSYSQLEQVILDSSVVGKSFLITLNPGEYQWKLKAQNSITESNTVSGKIYIDSTTDLTGTQVKLISPENNAFIGSLTQTFSWENMYNADVYNFELEHIDTSISKPDYDQSSIDIDFAYDGAYTWKVKGKNNASSTSTEFTSRQFIVDTYSPEAPFNFDPVDSVSIPLTQGGDSLVTLAWEGEIDHSKKAPVTDRLQISSSNAFQNSSLILNETISGFSNSARTRQVKILSPGKYYWRVKSTDKAENDSGYSDSRSFIVSFVL